MKSLRRTWGSDGKVHVKGVRRSSGIMDEPIRDQLLEVESWMVRSWGRVDRWG